MKKKILITVKTYPTLSNKYQELVCTAGVDEEGNWVRIYPIPFRKLDYEDRYKKYSWIELDLVKRTSDIRPESYQPAILDDIIILGNTIPTENGYWTIRKKLALKNQYTNLAKLISDTKDNKVSLATFKPTQIIDFVIKEEKEREWDPNKLLAMKEQISLFAKYENPFKVVKKLPYKYYYKFIDDNGTESQMMIEDWELGQLFWKCLKAHNGDEDKANADVKYKYFDYFAKTLDVYLFLGTTKQWHLVAPNPYVIIGVFRCKKDDRLTLF